jgi:signal transduction histidine kinase
MGQLKMTKLCQNYQRLNVFTANICSDLLPTCRAVTDLVTELGDEATISTRNKKLVQLMHAVQGIEYYFSCLVDFAHLVKQQPSVVLTHINLPKILKRLSSSMSAVLHAKHLNLTIHYGNKLPDILMGDYLRIEYILLGLLSNAIKFTSHGDLSIVFSKEKQQQDDLLVKMVVHDTEGKIKMQLKNNKHFRPGLTFVQQFLEDIGGVLKIDDKQGNDVIFICWLPFKLIDNV